MSKTRHLVDPEILLMLEMPDRVLTHETLESIRNDPLFSGADLPPPPFPVTEAFAPNEHGPEVRLVIMNPPSKSSPGLLGEGDHPQDGGGEPLRQALSGLPPPRDKLGEDRRAAILHIHGGGMVVGVPDTATVSKCPLALEHDTVVVSVDYRLAPETPFPGPQEDCYAALMWLAGHAEELGVDPDRIVVMGESAGGGLAASLAQMTRDRGGPKLAGQLLVYPMLDWRTGGAECPYRNRHTGEWLWTREKNRYGWECLRGDYAPTDARKGWFSPALADDLSGLPAAYIVTGALDLFLDEDLAYARRLIDAGVPCELHVYPGAIHAFEMVPATTLADQAATDLRRGLGRLLG